MGKGVVLQDPLGGLQVPAHVGVRDAGERTVKTQQRRGGEQYGENQRPRRAIRSRWIENPRLTLGHIASSTRLRLAFCGSLRDAATEARSASRQRRGNFACPEYLYYIGRAPGRRR